MKINTIEFEALIDHKIYNSMINSKEGLANIAVNDSVNVGLSLEDNILKISVKNKGITSVFLNNFKFGLFSTIHYKKAFCLINPKSSDKKISCVSLDNVKEENKILSRMFDIFTDEENHISTIFGFLGCKVSENVIENTLDDGVFKIAAECNFINQELLPGKEVSLDSIYMEEGDNIFSLFNRYSHRMADRLNINEKDFKRLSLNKSDTYSVLFTYRANSSTLEIDNKPVVLKVNGKKLYAVDISTEEGKKKVITNVNSVLKRANALNLNGAARYIEIIEDNRLFNAYHELSRLLSSIKDNFQGVRIYSDDYPLGLLDEKVILDNEGIAFEDKKFTLPLIGRKSKSFPVNYDFFIKLLMQRLVSFNKQSLIADNNKVNELMAVVLGNFDSSVSENKELIEMDKDIDRSSAVIPYIEGKKTFSMLLKGKRYMYLAVFNLESEPVKFYCDLSVHPEYKEVEGTVLEVYSNTNYLIADGKLYVRNLRAKDCCLFKKAVEAGINEVSL